MEEPRKDLLMQVDGMTCQGCVNSVTRAIQRLDPGARVEVDLEHGRVHVTTQAQSVEVARALDAAGYEARAMTG
ncbi:MULTISPECIES: heavy-metal-associated domain-containing protein [Hyphomicrobiales]|jgi:copper chaperone|uniref:heavy-metal-associated domain-containing protein n=1 Tax=Hyphomicrobiales TaxID=356 RepID=UPI002810E191|nr:MULTISPECIES: heavy-metal-associated domain-containing protein [Hyphomicrobiales]MEE1610450.1 heavy-metal-associated domain-containing protein [Microvirga sp. CF3016]HEV2566669.1 heavy-metal-associated domain-containing protein [Microvirga sp.]